VNHVEVRDLSKTLKGRKVLEHFDLVVPAGTLCVLRGPNGAGKSTLLRLIAGWLRPDGGHIAIAGHALDRARTAALAALSYVPDAPDVPPDWAVSELLGLWVSLRGAAAPDDALLARLGVAALLGERVGALSLGQRRRAFLAAALAGEPTVLVLDEPANGLDPEGRALLEEVLRERSARGHTSLVAAHEESFAAALSPQVVALRRN
jgi:ABC-2 type transport system ATP-binding protein